MTGFLFSPASCCYRPSLIRGPPWAESPVNSHNPARVVEGEVAAHVATDVPARRAELRVAEDAHELGPQAGHSDGVEGGPVGRLE